MPKLTCDKARAIVEKFLEDNPDRKILTAMGEIYADRRNVYLMPKDYVDELEKRVYGDTLKRLKKHG